MTTRIERARVYIVLANEPPIVYPLTFERLLNDDTTRTVHLMPVIGLAGELYIPSKDSRQPGAFNYRNSINGQPPEPILTFPAKVYAPGEWASYEVITTYTK